MSDNLIIREDGVGRLIRGVDALEIKLQNGGTSRWVRFNPKDQKSVNANGEYHATDDGVDGYRTITVNVPTRTKSQEPGRDQEIFNPDTGTGYYTDDEGLLHEEFVPDEIRIMHVPDKTSYQDGEAIDLDGIVVQAYKNGSVWQNKKYINGYIPAHELSIEPSIAEFDDSQKESDLGVTVSSNGLPITSICTYTRYGNFDHSSPPRTRTYNKNISEDRVVGGKAFATYTKEVDRYNGTIVDTYHSIGGWTAWDKYLQPRGDFSFTHNDKTVAYSGPYDLGMDNVVVLNDEHNIFISASCSYSAPQNGYRGDLEIDKMAWTAVFGETKESSSSDIAVSWPRPVDNLTLTASFPITVEQAEDTTSTGN